MSEFRATLFDGRSSKPHPVVVTLRDGVVSVRGEGIATEVEVSRCTVEAALGSTRRTLYTPDGGRLDTTDAAAFAALERKARAGWGLRVVHALERRWRAALTAALLAALGAWAVAAYGVPLVAEWAAFALPETVTRSIGETTLAQVDRFVFEPSRLEEARRREIREKWAAFAGRFRPAVPHRLVFRRSRMGPNAFALPSGVIVLTDELVDFVESDAELLGVLAHELAHLESRHALRSLFQQAGVFAMVSALVGDVASITSVAGTLPTILLESRYSRGFEREADDIAARRMIDAGLGVEPLIAFLERIGAARPETNGPDLFATHPATGTRVAHLHELATAPER